MMLDKALCGEVLQKVLERKGLGQWEFLGERLVVYREERPPAWIQGC